MFYYDGKILKLINYNKICSLNENMIEVEYAKNEFILVEGQQLKIIYLEPGELHLSGNILIIRKNTKDETSKVW